MTDQNMVIHLIAGGLAGTAGAVLTCPLEVVKTRLQSNLSDHSTTKNVCLNKTTIKNSTITTCHHINSTASYSTTNQTIGEYIKKRFKHNRIGLGLVFQLRSIVKNEGYRALFKGLVPNMIGVAPYRAIYFFSYANAKVLFLKIFNEEKPLLHVCAAIVAGFSAVSITNPIWFIKTRMQLDQSKTGLTAISVIRQILNDKGIFGFYKGITASYFGISETAIYFVIYEQLKRISLDSNETVPFLSYVTSAGFSKTFASCMCYPHEVARTRLRQVGDKYNGFFQTLNLVFKEEGIRALYKGLGTHLIKQIPNTVIIMTTYELILNYFIQCKAK